MTTPPTKIQSDFDHIAELSNNEWNHNNHYHSFLLKYLPQSSKLNALEIRCGTGSFTRLLAQRFQQVLAIDLSPRMIEIAKEHSCDYHNIDFQVADALTREFHSEQFGCIASIATLHHLPFDAILYKLKGALKTDGMLLVLDLFKAESLVDFSTALLAMPVSAILRLTRNGHIKESAEVKGAWAEHGRTDKYLTLSQVRQSCAKILPKAKVKRHLLWRYSIVWKKG